MIIKQKNQITMSNSGSFCIEIDTALLDVKSTRVKKLPELIAEGAVVAEGSHRNRTYKMNI